MQFIEKDDLLIIEYKSLDYLHQDLTHELLLQDVRKPKIKDYYGYNFTKQTWLSCSKKSSIGKKLHQSPNIKYIIGYVSNDQKTKEHEFYHYLYFSNTQYRISIKTFFDNKRYKPVLNKFYQLGYQKWRLYDEAQAFILTDKSPPPIYNKLKTLLPTTFSNDF